MQAIDVTESNSQEAGGVHGTNPFADDNMHQYMNDPNSSGDRQSGHHDFQQQFLKLPASSPYDNFLRAAGY
jgi:protein EFR3